MPSQPPPPKVRSRPAPKPAQLKRANEEIDRVLGDLAKPKTNEKQQGEEQGEEKKPEKAPG